MKYISKIIGTAVLSLLLSSCSHFVNKMATDTTANIAKVGSSAPFAIASYDFFTKALPGNILFLESLLANSPKNSTLYAQLIKAYSSFGFGYGETEMIRAAKSLQFSQISPFSQLSTLWYSKAISYAEQWLNSKGTSLEALMEAGFDLETKKEFLDKFFHKSDAEGLFYFGQAWASYLNFNRNRPELISQLPHAKILIDYACKITPHLDFGACDLFQAAFLLSRPKMLGGHPVEGEKKLLQLIKQYPNHLLYPMAYVQYVLIPQDRMSEVPTINQKLKQDFDSWQTSLYSLDTDPKLKQIKKEFSTFHLFNAIAYERFQAINLKTRK